MGNRTYALPDRAAAEHAAPGGVVSGWSRRRAGRALGGLAVLGALGLLAVVGGWGEGWFGGRAESAVSTLRLEDIPFDGAAAYEHLQAICRIGPRPSGSPGMAKQQQLLAEHFRKLGGHVELQRFRVRHPLDGSPVAMANLIVRWHPERRERILLGTHYDNIPFPNQDPHNPRGTFIGANDGASSVAVLMQLGHDMSKLGGPLGVDFVFFDGEEFVYSDPDRYFLGSEYFARQYANDVRRDFHYRWGVVLDMVGDKDLQIFQERNSAWWDDTRPLVEHIWKLADRLGVREFIARKKYEISDDHVPLHDIGKISCVVVIDYDYPYWHTEADTPDKCSALSLAKVGWVIQQWLREAK